MRQQNHPDGDTASEPCHIALACEAVLAGISCERVIEAIIKRIRRDEGYLAYRRASGRRTSYNELVTADLQELSLAAVLLQGMDAHPHSRRAYQSESGTVRTRASNARADDSVRR